MEHKFISIKEVFDKYKILNVPYYQRDYVWGIKNDGRNLYKFIDDIFTQYKENPSSDYFIGTLAFCSEKVNDIIDGQQRLTSIILILTILAKSKCSEDIINKNNNLIMPDEKFVIQEENYLTEEIKYSLGFENSFNSQGYKVDISKTIDRIKKQIEVGWSDYTTDWYDKLYDYILNNVKIISLEYSNIPESLKYFLNINSLSIQLTQSDIFYSILSQIIRISGSGLSIFAIKNKIQELSKMPGLNKDIDGYKSYDENSKIKGVDNIIYIFLNAYYKFDKDILSLNETGIGKWMSLYKNDVFKDPLKAKEFIDVFSMYLKDFEYIYKKLNNDINSDENDIIFTTYILLKYENFQDILNVLIGIFKEKHCYIKGENNLFDENGNNISSEKLKEICKRLCLTIVGNYIKGSNRRLDGFIENISVDDDNKYNLNIDEIVVNMNYESIFNLKYNDKKNVSPDCGKIKDDSGIIKVIMGLQEAFLNSVANVNYNFNHYFIDLLSNNFSIEHIYSTDEYNKKERLENWKTKKDKFKTAVEFDTERFSFENLSLLDTNTNSSCGTDEISEKLKKYKNAKRVCGTEYEYLIQSLVDGSEFYKNEKIRALRLPERKLNNLEQNTWELSDNNRDFNVWVLKNALKLIVEK